MAIAETSVGADPPATLGPTQSLPVLSPAGVAAVVKPAAKLRAAARPAVTETPVAAGIRAILNELSLECKAIVAARFEAAVFHLG
ncbi:hypothetical protein [Ensifer canadensis]